MPRLGANVVRIELAEMLSESVFLRLEWTRGRGLALARSRADDDGERSKGGRSLNSA